MSTNDIGKVNIKIGCLGLHSSTSLGDIQLILTQQYNIGILCLNILKITLSKINLHQNGKFQTGKLYGKTIVAVFLQWHI